MCEGYRRTGAGLYLKVVLGVFLCTSFPLQSHRNPGTSLCRLQEMKVPKKHLLAQMRDAETRCLPAQWGLVCFCFLLKTWLDLRAGRGGCRGKVTVSSDRRQGVEKLDLPGCPWAGDSSGESRTCLEVNSAPSGLPGRTTFLSSFLPDPGWVSLFEQPSLGHLVMAAWATKTGSF